MERIKGPRVREAAPAATLTGDLGFESIDVVDLFFELEQDTGMVIELGQVLGEMQSRSGRRFEELAVEDLIEHLCKHG